MPMKPTPMPKKTGKPKRPVMLPKTGPVRATPKPSGLMGMSKGGMAKAKGMAYGGMTEKPMAKPGYGTTAPMPGKGKRPMAMGMAKGGMTKKGKK